jgi:hypothetical protein
MRPLPLAWVHTFARLDYWWYGLLSTAVVEASPSELAGLRVPMHSASARNYALALTACGTMAAEETFCHDSVEPDPLGLACGSAL